MSEQQQQMKMAPASLSSSKQQQQQKKASIGDKKKIQSNGQSKSSKETCISSVPPPPPPPPPSLSFSVPVTEASFADGSADASKQISPKTNVSTSATSIAATTATEQAGQSPPVVAAAIPETLESLNSEISLGFGETITEFEDRSQTLVIREGPEPYRAILRTVIAYAIRCVHGRVPLQKVKHHVGYWLPYVYASENGKYLDTIGGLYDFFVAELKLETESSGSSQKKEAENGSTTTPTSSSPPRAAPQNEIPKSIHNFMAPKMAPETGYEKSKSSSGEGSGQNQSNSHSAGQQQLLSNIQMYSIYRFQIPDGQFITRYIFLAQWNSSSSSLPCCRDTANIIWLPIDNLLAEVRQENRQMLDRFWGYEIVFTCTTLQQLYGGGTTTSGSGNAGSASATSSSTSPAFITPQVHEFNSNEVLKYLQKPSTSTGTAAAGGAAAQARNASASFQKLLHEARFTEKDVIKIYCDFVQHCFPAAAMTYISFYEYFIKIGFVQFDDSALRNIFRAMNFKSKHTMMFNEFLLGLAALDSNAPNSKLRFTYIFRYYDRNSDGLLDLDDFRAMIADIRARGNLSCDPAEITADVNARLAVLKLLDANGKITFKAFLGEANHISGIVHLFRTNKAILDAIYIRHAYESISNKHGKPFGPRLIGTCPKCRPKKYSLAYHTVKLNAQGRVDDPRELVKLNCGELDAALQFRQRADENELRYSIECVFNEGSVANRVIAIIRKMQDFGKMTRERQKEISQFVVSQLTPSLIEQLCRDVTNILLIEPRVLKVNTPCIVIGDIHGNINDLLTYEEQLWPLAPSANSANLLFLGDYVDRGDYSIEVISYLFAMKLLAPTKFFLLRGNHEIRAIQRNFTFLKECMMKYAHKDGQKIFDAFNNAFDHLPLVGIIDESIYCAHGGIPFTATKIEDLYKIPIPLPDPEIQSKAAWEILWSDPITDEEYREVCQFHNQSADNGFADNIRRSTAYYFTEKALRNFLKSNSLSHVIRAHELEIDGYRFHHSGLLITVFSSSRYCNSLNRSAAVFVDSHDNDGFIKVIALDT